MARSAKDVDTRVDVVVVAVGGFAGEGIAHDWLRRGVPVLVEHPISPEFLTKLRYRHGWNPGLQVNGHFCELPEVDRFIRICRAAIVGHRASIVILATPRTIYSCLDIALSLLPPRQLSRIHFRDPHRDSVGDPVYKTGALTIKAALISGISARDNAAGSLGGHFIQLSLPDRRIALVGPTGPIVELNAATRGKATWNLGGRLSATSSSAYEAILRPTALVAALDRVVRQFGATASRRNFQRHMLVAKICYHFLRLKGVIPSKTS